MWFSNAKLSLGINWQMIKWSESFVTYYCIVVCITFTNRWYVILEGHAFPWSQLILNGDSKRLPQLSWAQSTACPCTVCNAHSKRANVKMNKHTWKCRKSAIREFQKIRRQFSFYRDRNSDYWAMIFECKSQKLSVHAKFCTIRCS